MLRGNVTSEGRSPALPGLASNLGIRRLFAMHARLAIGLWHGDLSVPSVLAWGSAANPLLPLARGWTLRPPEATERWHLNAAQASHWEPRGTSEFGTVQRISVNRQSGPGSEYTPGRRDD